MRKNPGTCLFIRGAGSISLPVAVTEPAGERIGQCLLRDPAHRAGCRRRAVINSNRDETVRFQREEIWWWWWWWLYRYRNRLNDDGWRRRHWSGDRRGRHRNRRRFDNRRGDYRHRRWYGSRWSGHHGHHGHHGYWNRLRRGWKELLKKNHKRLPLSLMPTGLPGFMTGLMK